MNIHVHGLRGVNMLQECSSIIHKHNVLILCCLNDFVKCSLRINFWSMISIYISFETCYEVDSEQVFSSCIHKYNGSRLLHSSDFCASIFRVWYHLCYMQTQLCFFLKNLFVVNFLFSSYIQRIHLIRGLLLLDL